jgi:hypothetical protein
MTEKTGQVPVMRPFSACRGRREALGLEFFPVNFPAFSRRENAQFENKSA